MRLKRKKVDVFGTTCTADAQSEAYAYLVESLPLSMKAVVMEFELCPTSYKDALAQLEATFCPKDDVDKLKDELDEITLLGDYELYSQQKAVKLMELKSAGENYSEKRKVNSYLKGIRNDARLAELVKVCSWTYDNMTVATLEKHIRKEIRNVTPIPPAGLAAAAGGSSDPKPPRFCDFCNTHTHNRDSCYSDPKSPKYRVPKVTNTTPKRALPTGKSYASAAASPINKDGSNYLYVDSCASMHNTGDESLLHDIILYGTDSRGSVTQIDGTSNAIYGEGKLSFTAITDDGFENSFTIDQVYLVQNMQITLLCLESLESSLQLDVSFKRRECRDASGDVAFNIEFEGTYNLPVIKNHTIVVPLVGSHASLAAATMKQWHNRLGHIGSDRLKIMNSQNMAEGLRITDASSPMSFCDTCALTKSVRKSYKNRKETKRNRELDELIWMDVCTMPDKSPEGFKYFLLIVEDSTGEYTLEGLTLKSDAEKHIKRYINRAGGAVKEVRSDNGGEFIGNSLVQFFDEKNIDFCTTVPHTPEQNGTSERGNRIINDKTRAMLKASGLPSWFWYSFAKAAAYIHNRTVSSRLNLKKTPFEARYGVKPNIDNLRTLGCSAFAHVPIAVRENKGDDRAIKCILVGYSDTSQSYILFNTTTHEFLRSDSVTFNENEFPAVSTDWTAFGNFNQDPDFEYESEDSVEDDLAEEPVEDHHSDNSVEGLDNEEEPVEVSENSVEEHHAVGRPRRNVPLQNYSGMCSLAAAKKALKTKRRRAWKSKQKSTTKSSVSLRGHCALAATDGLTYKAAMASDNAPDWKLAIDAHLAKMVDNGTTQECILPPGKRAIPCKWVLKEKFNADGSFNKFKARLTPLGYLQKEGIDYQNTYSPVAMSASYRMQFVIAAMWGRKPRSIDVDDAFQLPYLNEEVFMHKPPGYEWQDPTIHGGTQVLKLLKCLNGLKQSGNEFNKFFDIRLKNMGFKRLKSEPCTYMIVFQGDKLIVNLHVDDLIYVGQTAKIEKLFVRWMMKAFDGKIKDLGVTNEHLSVKVDYDEAGIYLSQTAYIESCLREINIPGETKLVEVPDAGYADPESNSIPFDDDNLFRTNVGRLNYLAGSTRPDIATAASYISGHSSKPTKDSWNMVKSTWKYLKDTKDLRLTYPRGINGEPMKIDLYADASYADDPVKARSRTGWILMVNGGTVAWYSKKQTLTAQSTEEAEVVALNEGYKVVSWLTTYLKELDLDYGKPTLHEDNTGTISWVKTLSVNMRNKHFNVKVHNLRDGYQAGDYDIVYVESSEQLADLFTKILPRDQHKYLVYTIGLTASGSDRLR